MTLLSLDDCHNLIVRARFLITCSAQLRRVVGGRTSWLRRPTGEAVRPLCGVAESTPWLSFPRNSWGGVVVPMRKGRRPWLGFAADENARPPAAPHGCSSRSRRSRASAPSPVASPTRRSAAPGNRTLFDMPWWHAVAERDHEIQNPTSREKIVSLGHAVRLTLASHVLAVARGKDGP